MTSGLLVKVMMASPSYRRLEVAGELVHTVNEGPIAFFGDLSGRFVGVCVCRPGSAYTFLDFS